MHTEQLLTHLNDLKQLPRTGWLLAGVVNPESVAEHSFGVIWLALLLAEQINQGWAAAGLTQPLDAGQVMQIALVHDVAESLLTDLPKRSAELLGRGIKYNAEAQAMQQLFAEQPGGDQWIGCWNAYANAATPEARLVRDADKLEMVQQALRYEQRGQRNLEEFWQGHTWHYAASSILYEHFLSQRRLGTSQ